MSFTDAPADDKKGGKEEPQMAIADPTIVPKTDPSKDEQDASKESGDRDLGHVASTSSDPEGPKDEDRQGTMKPAGSSPGMVGPDAKDGDDDHPSVLSDAASADPAPSDAPSGPAVSYPRGSDPAATRAVQRPIQPVQVDGRNRRNADDALEGHFVKVTDGEHAGRVGVFTQVVETEKDGYPKNVLVRTRDEFSELLTIAYKHLRHTHYKGGR